MEDNLKKNQSDGAGMGKNLLFQICASSFSSCAVPVMDVVCKSGPSNSICCGSEKFQLIHLSSFSDIA